MSRNPKGIANEILETFDYFSEPMRLLKIIESLLLSQGNSEIRAYEYASDILFLVRDEISRIIELNRKSAVASRCELIGDDFCTIIGSAFIRPTDSDDKKLFRESIAFNNTILDCLCALDSTDFELFCEKILWHMGALRAIKTKHSGDEGVDFLAQISLPSSFGNIDIGSFEEKFSITVFGQAKRYYKEAKVGTAEIRELVGSNIILRYNELFMPDDVLLNQSMGLGNIRLCDPLLCLFMTTGQFSIPAQLLAEKTGVVIKDGRQLATYIAVHRIGFLEYDALVFDKETFLKWLR